MRPAASHLPTLLPRLGLGLALSLTLTLGGCGDDTATDGAKPPGDGPSAPSAGAGGGAEPGSGRERIDAPVKPTPVELPEAPALTDEAAQAELRRALGDIAPEEASRASLLYLAELKESALADVVRTEFLARDGAEYDDLYAAALGLEILMTLGDKDAPAATIELARYLVEEEEEIDAIARALELVSGAQAAEADALLVELAQSEYDDVAGAAIESLAKRGSKSASSVLPGIAADAERYDAVRGTAVAAMLLTGDERAATSADALLGSDADGSEVIAGFGVPGAAATVPYIERIMAQALADGNADLEFAEACYALAAIYGGTPEAARGRDLLQGWLQRDADLDCDEATYALWVLGDTSRTDAAARLLASEVASAARHDVDLAVDLLEELARRGMARDPRFAKAVDAAAVTPPRQGLPGLDLSTQRLRAAAAYAYLRSR